MYFRGQRGKAKLDPQPYELCCPRGAAKHPEVVPPTATRGTVPTGWCGDTAGLVLTMPPAALPASGVRNLSTSDLCQTCQIHLESATGPREPWASPVGSPSGWRRGRDPRDPLSQGCPMGTRRRRAPQLPPAPAACPSHLPAHRKF